MMMMKTAPPRHRKKCALAPSCSSASHVCMPRSTYYYRRAIYLHPSSSPRCSSALSLSSNNPSSPRIHYIHRRRALIRTRMITAVGILVAYCGTIPSAFAGSTYQASLPAFADRSLLSRSPPLTSRLLRARAEVSLSSSTDDGAETGGRSAVQQIAEFISETDDNDYSASSPSSPSQQQNQNGDYSFFDEASIYVRAGSGGQGASTFKKAKKSQNGIPDGGSGGTGGNVVLVVDPSLNTLAGLSRRALRPNAFGGGGAAASAKRIGHFQERLLSFRAEDGKAGGRMYDNGRCGEDCEVRVPPGTVVSIEEERVEQEYATALQEEGGAYPSETSIDQEKEGDAPPTEIQYNLRELGTLTRNEASLIVARGGTGGEGTATLKGKKGSNKTRRGPTGGERHRLRLTLKIVADVALVGVPNAGKSTFLAAVTRAKPRIADYPFTTVVPNLGTWIPGDHGESGGGEQARAAGSAGLVLCDVPGLIEGAADGVGLGHAFLRHVERCRVIIHLIDGTAADPVDDYRMVNEEIRRYAAATKSTLATMPQVVVVNKIDAWQDLGEEEAERPKKQLGDSLKEAMGHTRLLWVSAKEREGVDDLMARMASYLDKIAV